MLWPLQVVLGPVREGVHKDSVQLARDLLKESKIVAVDLLAKEPFQKTGCKNQVVACEIRTCKYLHMEMSLVVKTLQNSKNK